MNIEILHVRAPGGDCTVSVFVDGKPMDDYFSMVDVDPGRGYQLSDWNDSKDFYTGPDYNGTPAFKAAVGGAYESWADNQYIDKEH